MPLLGKTVTERLSDASSHQRDWGFLDNDITYEYIKFTKNYESLEVRFPEYTWSTLCGDFPNVGSLHCSYDANNRRDVIFNIYEHPSSWRDLSLKQEN